MTSQVAVDTEAEDARVLAVAVVLVDLAAAAAVETRSRNRQGSTGVGGRATTCAARVRRAARGGAARGECGEVRPAVTKEGGASPSLTRDAAPFDSGVTASA